MKYKLKQDINYFPDWRDDIDITWMDKDYYKTGDIIVFNEWINKFGKPTDTYDFRMFSRNFIDENPHLFEVIE